MVTGMDCIDGSLASHCRVLGVPRIRAPAAHEHIFMTDQPLARLLPALACALLAAPTRAQDPVPPAGGFPVLEQLNQLVTYSDGYQTRFDLRMPDPGQVAPPATGWPMLLMVHGFTGSRSFFTASGEAASFASRGYVTVTYDVRGQGNAKALNPTGGTTVSGKFEKGDMAELFHLLEQQLGPQMDFERLAVFGTSQGGDHAWAAAAFSEQLLPEARGAITHFPRITAVVPRAGTPNSPELWNPQGAAFPGNFTRLWFRTTAVLEPAYEAQLQQTFLAQDFTGLSDLLRNDPWRGDAALLPTSDVAVFLQYSWDDFVIAENAVIDGFNSLPSTTPRLAHLSTGIHGSPVNDLEADLSSSLSERWLDHVVKGFADDVALQPDFLLANIPADDAVAASASSVWNLVQTSSYPATGTTTDTTLYLRQSGALSPSPPTGSEPAETIQHRVAPGFDPAAWVLTGNNTAQVLASVPLSSVEYRDAPLPAAKQLIGRGTARIHVDSIAPNLQLSVALFDEDPSGQLRYVTSGFRCVRGRAPGVTAYDVEMRGTNYTFPAGHRLVVAVENHTWHRPLGIDELRTVPYFEDYDFDCLHTATEASRVTLPLTDPLLSARASATELSVVTGGSASLPVDGSPLRAGSTYLLLASVSGSAPGVVYAGQTIPINPDGVTSLALGAPGSPPFSSFLGVLDASGQATASFDLLPGQLPLSAVGLRVSFAGLTVEPSGALSTSAASYTELVL
jgi:predicted acyl esterase